MDLRRAVAECRETRVRGPRLPRCFTADQAMQIAREVGVVLIALEQFRTWPDRADRYRLRSVPRSPPIETCLARDHAPQRILRRIAEVSIERTLIRDRFAQVGIELKTREMLRDQLG